MDDLMRVAIENEVRRQIDMQKEELHEVLFRGCNKDDTFEKVFSNMVINAVYCSVTLAAEMAIDILLESGKFTPQSDDELRWRIFSVCGQKDEQTLDSQT